MRKHPGGRPPLHGTATVTYTLRLTPGVRDEFLRIVEAYKAKAAAQNMSATSTHVFVDMLRRYQQANRDAAPPPALAAPAPPSALEKLPRPNAPPATALPEPKPVKPPASEPLTAPGAPKAAATAPATADKSDAARAKRRTETSRQAAGDNVTRGELPTPQGNTSAAAEAAARADEVRAALEAALGQGLTATALADKAGIDKGALSRFRKGAGTLGADKMKRLQRLVRKLAPPAPDVVELTRAIAKERNTDLIPVAELVRRLGGPVDKAHARIVAAAKAEKLELRPESGMGLLSKKDEALCLPGPRGSVLSYARVLG